ncbi:HIG1 domain-containing protein [Sphingosinicella sp. BN140058]|uniref:HIG1 domain-containing protein n=1 Tax=Sphingosinicella sp. BN140058 TaxID=1892855 RepID=UPI0013EAB31E|nr:HIG1 domain-containing protein [Sphingosinicella sp. BN140058]
MQILLFILIAVAAAATLHVLVRGVIGMANGATNPNVERSQALMQKRVTYQAVAIVFAILFIMVGRAA